MNECRYYKVVAHRKMGGASANTERVFEPQRALQVSESTFFHFTDVKIKRTRELVGNQPGHTARPRTQDSYSRPKCL